MKTRFNTFNTSVRFSNTRRVNGAALSAALLALSAGAAARAGSSFNNDGYLVTISLSGSTATRAFLENLGSTSLDPGTTITLSNGTYTDNDSSASEPFTPVNSAYAFAPYSSTYANPTSNPNLVYPTGNGANTGEGLRTEWHEQGAVAGVLELVHDQIIPYSTDPNSAFQTIGNSSRSPTTLNPAWVNGQSAASNNGRFQATGTVNGYTLGSYDYLQAQALATWTAANLGVAPSPANGAPTYTGQNLVQAAVNNGNAIEAFSISGTPSYAAKPDTAGYGKGNPALPTSSLTAANTANSSFQLADQTVLNNAALGLNNGLSNLQSTDFAKSATVLAANPGTGLTRLNQTDAQWLQLTSRLQNGAGFNFISGDVNNGTKNVAANDTGVDPSWVVGKNDSGNGAANDPTQNLIGSNIRYSNKTSLSTGYIPTVRNARLGVTTLGLGEARSAGIVQNNTSAGVVRALDYANSATDPTNTDATSPTLIPQTDGSGNIIGYLANQNQWARVSLKNIITGGYFISQNQTFVSVVNPDPTGPEPASGPKYILGDPGNDVLAYENNILNSANAVPLGSLTGPGNTLLANGFVPLKLALAQRDVDGETFSLNPAAESNLALIYGSTGPTDTFNTPDNPSPDSALGDPTITSNFSVNNPALQTSGVGSYYGFGGANSGTQINDNSTSFNGKILITDPNAASTDPNNHQTGNWLLGNFNQNGVRDLSSLETGLFALKALDASGKGFSGFTADAQASNYSDLNWSGFISANSAALSAAGVSLAGLQNLKSEGLTNGTGTAVGADKGDLIVLGDINSDGHFDGKDLYQLAHDTALVDDPNYHYPGQTGSPSTTGLTAWSADATNGSGTASASFGDEVRHGLLQKNTALDFLQNNTTAGDHLRTTAAVTTTFTGTGATAPVAPAGSTVVTQTSTGSGAATVWTVTYSFDPTGINAFNKSDVNHDGLVDIADAIEVDAAATPYTGTDADGNSYAALGKDYYSLADQTSTTVTIGGVKTLVSLVDARQHDGGLFIDAAGGEHGFVTAADDLSVINTQLDAAHPGAVHWYAGKTIKSGPNTIVFGRTAAGSPVSIEPGASFEIAAGIFQAAGSADPFTDTVSNSGSLPVTVDFGAELEISAGTKQISTLNLGVNSNVTVNSFTPARTLLIADNLVIPLGLPSGTPAGTVALAPRGDLLIKGGQTADQVRLLTKAGYRNGSWSGTGITSASATPYQGIGYLSGSDYLTLNPSGLFDGATVASSDVVVKYTYQGDANLDGKITAADYAQINAGFLLQSTGSWLNGDFNYDGVIDYKDYALIDAAYLNQSGALADSEIALHSAEFGSAYTSYLSLLESGATVPEPASLALMACSAVALLRRRRAVR